MRVQTATREIIPAWEELAREVEPLFEGRMAGEKDFRDFMARKIRQKEAFIVLDRSGGLTGLIAISHQNNGISWFAVHQKYRGKGIGEALLAYAIDELDKTKEINVITFKEENPGGLPARRLYHKYGFIDFDNHYFAEGHFRCLMKRFPGTN